MYFDVPVIKYTSCSIRIFKKNQYHIETWPTLSVVSARGWDVNKHKGLFTIDESLVPRIQMAHTLYHIGKIFLEFGMTCQYS